MIKYIYFIALWIYGFFEIFFQFKVNRRNNIFDMTYFGVTIPFFLLLLLPIYFLFVDQYTPRIVNIVVFFLLFLAGVLIRLKGYIDLGTNFSDKVELKSNQILVNYGIYKYIRHPLYLASFLMIISVVCYKNSYITYIFALLTTIGIALRIYKEGKLFNEKFERLSRIF